MAGPACKVVIDHGLHAAMSAAERILIDPSVHMDRIPEEARMGLIQMLAEVAIAAYQGGRVPHGGVAGILVMLEQYGIVTAEVWSIFRRP